MAYFERADERDRLICCNICNVNCAERSLTNHRISCRERNLKKFQSQLVVCKYDSGHIVEADKLDLHLEFCTKRQSEIVSEYQEESKIAKGPIDITIPESPSPEVDDEWNHATDDVTNKFFTLKV